jgi:hypothetical protein
VASITNIGEDVAFGSSATICCLRRYLRAAIERYGQPQAHVPMFSMINYLPLYIHESYRAMQTPSSTMYRSRR